MKIKIVTYKDVPCVGPCGRMDVKHHGKGMCRNCYHNEYWHANLSPKLGVDKVKEKVKNPS